MEEPQATVRLLTNRQDPLFWPALEFYVESFPRDEREPLERIARVSEGDPAICDRPKTRVHMAVAELEGRLAGIRYFSYYAAARLGFFIYLAVEVEFRKRGIGAMLVDFGKEICARDAAELGSTLDAIFFECERPELAETPAERVVRDRRLEYFQRRGAIIVSTDYFQPALGPDREAVPLYILAYPMTSNPNWEKLVRDFHSKILGYEPDSEEERRAVAAIQIQSVQPGD
jgi:GNAT superfamily N-acetyltransferase